MSWKKSQKNKSQSKRPIFFLDVPHYMYVAKQKEKLKSIDHIKSLIECQFSKNENFWVE